jgi:hypothetical protein
MKWLVYEYDPKTETTTRRTFELDCSRHDVRLAYAAAVKRFNALEDNLLVIPTPPNYRG